jgi:hypothetical protein
MCTKVEVPVILYNDERSKERFIGEQLDQGKNGIINSYIAPVKPESLPVVPRVCVPPFEL